MGVAVESTPEIARPSSGATSGVLVFTSSIQLLYRDQQARELCERINRYENGRRANGVLPSAVTSLADEIRKLLRIRKESKDWEQFQIRRVVGCPDYPVQLCGFGLLDADIGRSRIVVILQEVGLAFWHKRVLDRAKEHFQLTSRETEILQHLLKGWTNKEIATALKVCEQTIKEHMKHIGTKTDTTNRTGIVMKAVLCGLHHDFCKMQSESAAYSCRPSQPHFGSDPYNRHVQESRQNEKTRDFKKLQVLPGKSMGLTDLSSQVSYASPTPLWSQDR